MTFSEIIKHFGSQVAAAQKLGISQPTISMWRARGRIPALQQLRIQHVTRGKLKADPAALKVSR
jgi:DNA-binding transcriptional regulator YdaS (Cro superfamily)